MGSNVPAQSMTTVTTMSSVKDGAPVTVLAVNIGTVIMEYAVAMVTYYHLLLLLLFYLFIYFLYYQSSNLLSILTTTLLSFPLNLMETSPFANIQ